MNPAYSVILFTTASGAGYGLLALLGLAGASHGRASTMGFAFTSMAIALALITLGLLSSTFHLGRPERAWRAFSQWRSSWLSREGVLAVATYPVALAFFAVWSGLVEAPNLIAPLGWLMAILCWFTVLCTAMIYASLKTIPAWNSRLTVVSYLAFAGATGATWLTVIAYAFGRFVPFQSILACAAIIAALVVKFIYWRHLDRRMKTFTMAQATGLGDGVRQWEVPHTAQNFIMKEMGYTVARNHARRLRRYCLFLLDIAFFLMAFAGDHPWLSVIALPVLMLAAWVERWLFFAQAEHVVGLYYGKPSV